MIRYGNFVVLQAELLYLLIPIAVLLIFLLRKKFVQDNLRLFRARGKFFILLSKILFFAFLLIALATPYLEYEDTKGNLTKIKVLVDRSESMEIYDVEAALSRLESVDTPLDIVELQLADYSSIGQSILNNIAPDENLLLVTDGQNNFGTDLEDVALFASTINSKLYAISLEEKEEDAAITISGPSKVVSGVENTFTVQLNEVGNVRKRVKIFVDEVLETEEQYETPIELKKSFSSGSHVIRAVLENDDHFQQNNEFIKVVNVHEKPKLLFVSKSNSPLYELYYDFYDVDLRDDIGNIDKYHAVVLNNINADELSEDDIEKLEDYLNEENGLFVVGGKSSYDWGSYNTSLITNILPVSIGKAKKKKDIVNIVLLMDTGAGAHNSSWTVQPIDVQKAVAAEIVKGLSSQNKVAIIEANYYLNTITGLSEIGPKREQVVTDIALLKPAGASEFEFAYQKAHEMLRLNKGSKNIVMITDGKIRPYEKAMLPNLIKNANKDGIKTYVIGVITPEVQEIDETFMKELKEVGKGEYFTASEQQKIKLYFGDPGEEPSDRVEAYVYDSNHFITREVDDIGRLYGYNTVYPKSNARLLLTTNTGEPILTIWNYGLGRVASLSTDDGTLWNPEMLSSTNSEVLIRTINWLVENPERKNNLVVEIPQLRLGENAQITVKSDTLPQGEFYEEDKGIYKGNFYANETGLIEILGTRAGVNYKKEYLYLGIDSNLEQILQVTGGEVIEEDFDDSLKSMTKVETIKTKDLSWYFVLAAISLYLLEILIRRLSQMRLEKIY